MKRTRINDLFGIEYPIIQGGMAHVSRAELAAAVSNAGGLGIIGSATMFRDELSDQIDTARSLTDKPFGVNIPLLRPQTRELADVIIEKGVKIVFTAAGNPATYTGEFKEAGCVVTHVVATVKMAKGAERKGVDAVVCEGFEAGGHDGHDMLTTMSLAPQVADAVDIPVIAAGGITDPRGMVAAFALGAEGIQMGTRFIATEECNAHSNFKQALVDADDLSTVFIGMKQGPVRVLKNKLTMKIARAEAENDPDITVATEGAGKGELGTIKGDMNEGMLNMSQASGLIDKIVSCRELIKNFVDEYDRIVERIK